MSAPRRANSDAIALPNPVPPPVTNTTVSSNVPAGSAVAPIAGGSGSPIISLMGESTPRVVRRAVFRTGGTKLREVVGLVDEGLADELFLHRRPHLRLGEVPDDAAGDLPRDRRRRRDLLCHLARHCVELLGRDYARHDAVRECLVRIHRATGEHEVAHHTV